MLLSFKKSNNKLKPFDYAQGDKLLKKYNYGIIKYAGIEWEIRKH